MGKELSISKNGFAGFEVVRETAHQIAD